MVSLVAAFLLAADAVPLAKPVPSAPAPVLAPLPPPEPPAATNAPVAAPSPPPAPPVAEETPANSTPAATNAASDVPQSLISAPKHPVHDYPWHSNVLTQLFTIGSKPADGGDVLNDGWAIPAEAGTEDTPDSRNGFAPADRVLRCNTFYVALPFNDLAYPAVSARFLPTGWVRDIQNGKIVSSCQHRWIEIKNADGKRCYAQWEDVGPGENTRAEYVFAREPAGPGPALGLSPAVVQYLKINTDDPKAAGISWRFVEDENIPPGPWLKYEEEAIIYNALRAQDNPATNVTPVPVPPTPQAATPLPATNAAPQPAPPAAKTVPSPSPAPKPKPAKPVHPTPAQPVPARPVTPSSP